MPEVLCRTAPLATALGQEGRGAVGSTGGGASLQLGGGEAEAPASQERVVVARLAGRAGGAQATGGQGGVQVVVTPGGRHRGSGEGAGIGELL